MDRNIKALVYINIKCGEYMFSRFIEDQEEKKETLVNFFCKNIHNKYGTM